MRKMSAKINFTLPLAGGSDAVAAGEGMCGSYFALLSIEVLSPGLRARLSRKRKSKVSAIRRSQ